MMWHVTVTYSITGPSRGRKGEKIFQGPTTFGGLCHHSKILKSVFQIASFWPQICIKSIFGRGSTPDPTKRAYDTPQTPSQMVRGHPSPSMPSASRFWSICNRGVTGPHNNGFPGPAVALDGPAASCHNLPGSSSEFQNTTPSALNLWVPPSTYARLHWLDGGVVTIPSCVASFEVAPSAHTNTFSKQQHTILSYMSHYQW